MSRELHPKLFIDSSGDGPLELAVPLAPPSPQELVHGYLAKDVRGLESRVQEMRVQVQALEKHSEKVTQTLHEFIRQTQVRFERFSQALLRLEENQTKGQKDVHEKVGTLVSRLNERRVTDNKLADLMERHNQMVRNFENRLMALQRVVSEQELQLHNAHAALDEARQELARLRRF